MKSMLWIVVLALGTTNVFAQQNPAQQHPVLKRSGGVGHGGGTGEPYYIGGTDSMSISIMGKYDTASLYLQDEPAQKMFENLKDAKETRDSLDVACVIEKTVMRMGPGISCYREDTAVKPDCFKKLGFKKETIFHCEILIAPDGSASSRDGGF